MNTDMRNNKCDIDEGDDGHKIHRCTSGSSQAIDERFGRISVHSN
jgi:hypothetical protein